MYFVLYFKRIKFKCGLHTDNISFCIISVLFYVVHRMSVKRTIYILRYLTSTYDKLHIKINIKTDEEAEMSLISFFYNAAT